MLIVVILSRGLWAALKLLMLLFMNEIGFDLGALLLKKSPQKIRKLLLINLVTAILIKLLKKSIERPLLQVKLIPRHLYLLELLLRLQLLYRLLLVLFSLGTAFTLLRARVGLVQQTLLFLREGFSFFGFHDLHFLVARREEVVIGIESHVAAQLIYEI